MPDQDGYDLLHQVRADAVVWADDRAVAYAAYLAALDREQSAADLYAQQVGRVASFAPPGAPGTSRGPLLV